MGRIYTDNALSIGNTPLVQIQRLAGTKARVLGKVEGRNPAYSVKCRIGAAMVWDAEKRGVLKPGMEILEATSGNTGIALAFVGAARGYKVTLTMPESMSIERRRILQALGANLVLTEASLGMPGAIKRAEAMHADAPQRFFMAQQFNNQANPAIHEETTGAEIWADTGGAVDVVVAGIGTGGTITGISRYIKNRQSKKIVSVGVEPANSAVISQHLAGEQLKPGPHMIQGLGAGFIPKTLDLSMVDRIAVASNDEAFDFARRLSREEGILSGISSGAAMAVAARLANDAEFEGKTIVVIFPDSGERYLSTTLFG